MSRIVLHDDIMRLLVPYVPSDSVGALSQACRTTRDAAVLRDVADGSFELMQTTERHFVELAKRNGFNTYFQDLFGVSTEEVCTTHLKWKSMFARLGDVGTLSGKVPRGVTAGVLHLLKYGSREQLEALAEMCDRNEMDDPQLLLETRKRLQKLLENGPATEVEVLCGILELGKAHRWMYQFDESAKYYESAKQGFKRLLGEVRERESYPNP